MTYLHYNGQELEIGKIICLLRSYRGHADEMDTDVPETPEFFLKPSTAVIQDGQDIVIPAESGEVHHEVELAVIIGTEGKAVPKEYAMEHVFGYAVMIDVTARDIQARAKKAGRPWSAAKGYDSFAPISRMVPRAAVPNPQSLDIWLKVNGEYRQRGNTNNMAYTIPEIIARVSSVMSLLPGDIIATGTPEGVSRIRAGDVVEAGIEGIGTLRVGVRAASGH